VVVYCIRHRRRRIFTRYVLPPLRKRPLCQSTLVALLVYLYILRLSLYLPCVCIGRFQCKLTPPQLPTQKLAQEVEIFCCPCRAFSTLCACPCQCALSSVQQILHTTSCYKYIYIDNKFAVLVSFSHFKSSSFKLQLHQRFVINMIYYIYFLAVWVCNVVAVV
jgi:hypothetical protein